MMQAILLGSFRSDGFDSDIMFINCRFDWPFFVADMIAVSRVVRRDLQASLSWGSSSKRWKSGTSPAGSGTLSPFSASGWPHMNWPTSNWTRSRRSPLDSPRRGVHIGNKARGLPYMMSALEGGSEGVPKKQTKGTRLRELCTWNFCGRHRWKPPNTYQHVWVLFTIKTCYWFCASQWSHWHVCLRGLSDNSNMRSRSVICFWQTVGSSKKVTSEN